jgi:uncharacterized OB-fold protein
MSRYVAPVLVAARCSVCGEVSYPPRDRCARCGAAATEIAELEGHGRVIASTWVPAPFGLEGFAPDGYGVAWVDLDDGPRVQVLVADAAPPRDAPGSVGVLTLEGVELPVFEPEAV